MKNQKDMTVVVDPSEVEGTEQTPQAEPERIWANPFAIRPCRDIRGFVLNSLGQWADLPELTECPTAEEMARLTRDVMELSVEQLSRVLAVPVGPVALWLDPDSGSRPSPGTVAEPPEWSWRTFLQVFSLAQWWEAERERQGIVPSAAGASAKAKAK